MSAPAASPVAIRACAQDDPSIPPWFAGLVLLARHLDRRGALAAIRDQVRLARRRAGRYDAIDVVAVLFGYAVSGESTLEAFFDRLRPFARTFMGAGQLPLPSNRSVGGRPGAAATAAGYRRLNKAPASVCSFPVA
jgi:hypothetical protein